MATLTALHVFPLKSCAPLTMREAQVQLRGLAHDRRWMVVDADDRFMTARKFPRMTLVRAQSGAHGLQLDAPGMPSLHVAAPHASGERLATEVWGAAVLPLLADASAHAWMSQWLGVTCRIVHMDDACRRAVRAKYDGRYGEEGDEVSLADGFPLLLISQGSLDYLNTKLAAPVPMLRFRPNLVVSGTPAHAEDAWKRIRIGEIEMDVVKPCTRCVLTTVDFNRGEFDPSGEPLRTLISYRRTGDGVSFGQNLIPRGTGVLRIGDAVSVLA